MKALNLRKPIRWVQAIILNDDDKQFKCAPNIDMEEGMEFDYRGCTYHIRREFIEPVKGWDALYESIKGWQKFKRFFHHPRLGIVWFKMAQDEKDMYPYSRAEFLEELDAHGIKFLMTPDGKEIDKTKPKPSVIEMIRGKLVTNSPALLKVIATNNLYEEAMLHLDDQTGGKKPMQRKWLIIGAIIVIVILIVFLLISTGTLDKIVQGASAK